MLGTGSQYLLIYINYYYKSFFVGLTRSINLNVFKWETKNACMYGVAYSVLSERGREL